MKEANITLKTFHKTFITAEDGGGPQTERVGGRPKGLGVANRQSIGAWERLDIKPVPGEPGCVSLWSVNGFALAAESDSNGRVTGEAVFNRSKAQTWECWRVGRNGEGITLLSHDGASYLCAEPDGRLVVRRPGSADGKPSLFETFFPNPKTWLDPDPVIRTPGIVGQLKNRQRHVRRQPRADLSGAVPCRRSDRPGARARPRSDPAGARRDCRRRLSRAALVVGGAARWPQRVLGQQAGAALGPDGRQLRSVRRDPEGRGRARPDLAHRRRRPGQHEQRRGDRTLRIASPTRSPRWAPIGSP